MTVAIEQYSLDATPTSIEELDDAELVTRACEGDRQAFGQLVRRHSEQLEYAARTIVSGADVEDVTQRSWLKIFRKLESLREPRFFRAWANRITINTALAHIRKYKRRKETDIDALPPLLLVTSEKQGSEDLVHWRRLVERTREWMRDLDAKDHEIFYGFLVEGMTMDEIADQMGMSSGGVKVRLFRARQELRGLRDQICG